MEGVRRSELPQLAGGRSDAAVDVGAVEWHGQRALLCDVDAQLETLFSRLCVLRAQPSQVRVVNVQMSLSKQPKLVKLDV